MGLPEAVAFARNFAVMVRVRGPDPKGLKMRRHAFHQYRSGETTLSASGMLIPANLYDTEVAKHLYGDLCEAMCLVVTVASVVEPFLPQQRENVSQGRPELISGVRLMLELRKSVRKQIKESLGLRRRFCHIGFLRLMIWDTFCYVNLTDWWISLHQPIVSSHLLDHLSAHQSSGVKLAGLWHLRLMILSIQKIFYKLSISVGCIANSYPPNSSDGSLLMADIRNLPGMEGSPIFSEYASLTGILIRPLRQKTSSVEIQLVIPWEVIVTASSGLLRNSPQNTVRELYHEGKSQDGGKGSFAKTDNVGSWDSNHEHSMFGSSSSLRIEKAMASIFLVTIDDVVWASGVLLNSQGLILTNAHLLEPWRFGKTQISAYGDNPKIFPLLAEGAASVGKGVEDKQHSQTRRSKMTILDPFSAHEREGYISSPNYNRHQTIRVRLDHVKPTQCCLQ